MNEVLINLNNKVGPLLREVEHDLNKWSFGEANPLPAPGNIYHTPILAHLGNATIVNRDVEAFNLLPPEAGMIKDRQLSKDELGDIIVIRRVIGYFYASRISSGDLNSNCLKPIIKEMVNTLITVRGFTPDKLNVGIYGTFERPGSTNDYFRDLEHSAGYELRLYSATTLAEKLND